MESWAVSPTFSTPMSALRKLEDKDQKVQLFGPPFWQLDLLSRSNGMNGMESMERLRKKKKWLQLKILCKIIDFS